MKRRILEPNKDEIKDTGDGPGMQHASDIKCLIFLKIYVVLTARSSFVCNCSLEDLRKRTRTELK
jgi:hypothetical protein